MTQFKECPECSHYFGLGIAPCKECEEGVVICNCSNCGRTHENDCANCSGWGDHPCRKCNGTGQIPIEEEK